MYKLFPSLGCHSDMLHNDFIHGSFRFFLHHLQFLGQADLWRLSEFEFLIVVRMVLGSCCSAVLSFLMAVTTAACSDPPQESQGRVGQEEGSESKEYVAKYVPWELGDAVTLVGLDFQK